MMLCIYGAGGLGKEILEIARIANKVTPQWEEIIFVDDSINEGTHQVIDGVKVVRFESLMNIIDKSKCKFVIGVGEPYIRQQLREKVENAGFKLQTIIHPRAEVSAKTIIGEGVIICYGSYVSCFTKIGNNVYLQPNSSIGHEVIIGSDSVISTFVSIAGNCKIGTCSYIGMSVPVKEGTTIGDNSIVGMGSCVIRDIPNDVVALGNPARAMKGNESHRVFKS